MRPFYFLLPILILFSCSSSKKQITERPKREFTLQDGVVNYLALKGFSNSDFAKQALGEDVICEKYERYGKWLYFSAKNNERFDEVVNNICSDTSVVEYGTLMEDYDQVYLGKVVIDDPEKMLFRFPSEYLKFDSTRVITQKFDNATYEISLYDLRDFLAANNLFNGPALAIADTTPDGKWKVLANHAAPIAAPGEETLTQLAYQIIDTTDNQEKQAQDLLDFVTRKINYKDHGKYEIFMKPNETLLSGETDCSGKVVLYSSFLTQVGIPHLLVYMPGHICVGVKGDFSENNGMFFEHETGRYYIAETTALDFQIGETRFMNPISEESFEFLQRPGYKTKLYDVERKDSLEFAVVEIEVE